MAEEKREIYSGREAIRFVAAHGGWLRYADKHTKGGGRIVSLAEAKKLARWHPRRITGGPRAVKRPPTQTRVAPADEPSEHTAIRPKG